MSDLVSRVWCRITFDQSELSVTRIPPTASPKVRPGPHPWVNKPSFSRRSAFRGTPTLSLHAVDFAGACPCDKDGKLGLKERLTAGALAGMTGTFITHPLDTIRLRLALPNHGYTGMVNAFSTVYKTEGVGALYKAGRCRLTLSNPC